ncbi:MAG: hypothetical protein RL375_1853 [Pseudomonadota bacterium]
MGLIVMLTGGFGWLASFLLLQAGMDGMAWRYPVALGLAYLFFLFLLWLWLRGQAGDAADMVDLATSLPMPQQGHLPSPRFASGGGGDFGGGGATGSFAEAGEVNGMALDSARTMGDVGKLASSVSDSDEWAIPLVAICLVAGLAVASFYVIYLAPSLFAELLFDGALSYTLYRRLRGRDGGYWLGTAVRRTALPFALTAVFLCAMGATLTAYAPGARSLFEVVHHRGAGK